MKTTTTAIVAVLALALTPHIAMAKPVGTSPSQNQTVANCLKADAGSAKDANAKIDCSATKGAALAASNGGTEDNGTETESGADSDADAED